MRYKNITNQNFHGTCKAIQFLRYNNKYAVWLFECLVKGPGCKGIFEAPAARVKTGDRKSCGCHVRENIIDKVFYNSVGEPTCKAIKYLRSDKGNAVWQFECLVKGPGCKGTFKALSKNVRCGRMKSCGCYHKINASKIHTIHGLSKTSVYNTWFAMNDRCYNPDCDAYSNYGERGIIVCERWHKDNSDGLINFYNDIGYRLKPGDTLERDDNDLGYSSDNCDIIPKEMQPRNRRVNKIQSLEEANHIRDVYKNHNWSIKNMAEFFRCSTNTIRSIIRRETWV